jgi:hypothetical protein
VVVLVGGFALCLDPILILCLYLVFLLLLLEVVPELGLRVTVVGQLEEDFSYQGHTLLCLFCEGVCQSVHQVQ